MKALFLVLVAGSLVGCVATRTVPTPPPATATVAPQPLQYWPADGHFPGSGRTSSWKDFPRHNEARRSLFAAHAEQEKDGIVFVGDSITEGWRTLQTDFADLPVQRVNRGIGGDTTPNLLYRLEQDVLSLQPRALVVLIGTNDLGEHTPPVEVAANLRALLRRVRAVYPEIPIAWCLVMPRGDGPQFRPQIEELNRLIRELCASDPRITVCDTYSALALSDGTYDPAKFLDDRLHLKPEGYQAWAEALRPILRQWSIAAAR